MNNGWWLHNKNYGFTLLEAMISLAVAAILTVMVMPAFKSIITSSTKLTDTDNFLISLSLARSEAIKRKQRVVLCKSSDGSTCNKTGDWTQGWVVFVDIDNNAVINSGVDIILTVHSALINGDTLIGNSPVSNYISYTYDGSSRYTSGAFQAGTLTFGLCKSGYKNTIVINSAGRVRKSQIAC